MKAGKSQENNHKSELPTEKELGFTPIDELFFAESPSGENHSHPEDKASGMLEGSESLHVSSGSDIIQKAQKEIEEEIEEEKKILYSVSPNALKGIEKQLQLTLKERAVYIELLKAELKGFKKGFEAGKSQEKNHKPEEKTNKSSDLFTFEPSGSPSGENHSQQIGSKKELITPESVPTADNIQQALEFEDEDVYINKLGIKLYPARECFLCKKEAFMSVGICGEHSNIDKFFQEQKKKFDDLQNQFEHLYKLKEEQKKKFEEILDKWAKKSGYGKGDSFYEKVNKLKSRLFGEQK